MRRALIAIVCAACSKAGDESQARRAPIAPPPPAEDVHVPQDLRIPVRVDGADAPPLTAAALAARAPDYSDRDHHAWRLTALVPAFDRDGEVLEARGRDGVALTLVRPASPQAPQPVLFLTRRGDVAVTMLDPADPFPDYHGQGGRLKRQGDPLPRLQPVVALEISRRP